MSKPSSLQHNNAHARQAAERNNTTQRNTKQAVVCHTAMVNWTPSPSGEGPAAGLQEDPTANNQHAAAHASQITQHTTIVMAQRWKGHNSHCQCVHVCSVRFTAAVHNHHEGVGSKGRLVQLSGRRVVGSPSSSALLAVGRCRTAVWGVYVCWAPAASGRAPSGPAQCCASTACALLLPTWLHHHAVVRCFPGRPVSLLALLLVCSGRDQRSGCQKQKPPPAK